MILKKTINNINIWHDVSTNPATYLLAKKGSSARKEKNHLYVCLRFDNAVEWAKNCKDYLSAKDNYNMTCKDRKMAITIFQSLLTDKTGLIPEYKNVIHHFLADMGRLPKGYIPFEMPVPEKPKANYDFILNNNQPFTA